MKKKEQQAAPVMETDLAVQEPVSVEKYDWQRDAEQFKDQFDRSSLQIPFIRIIQSNSPELDADDAKFLEDAKMGEYVNTVTGETTKTFLGIPVFSYATFIEWIPRNQGGGYVADHGFDGGNALLPTCTKNEKKKDVLPNGNELVRTEVYFLLYQDKEGNWNQAMTTMTSTALKKARQLNSRIRMHRTKTPDGTSHLGAPMFWNVWEWTTVKETNKDGSWYNYEVENPRPILDQPRVYQEARSYREVVEQGLKQGRINLDVKAEDTPNPGEEGAPF